MHPRARIEHLHVVEHQGGLLIRDTRTGSEHELQPLAACVWKNADGSTSVDDLAALARTQFGPVVDLDQVWAALDSLSGAQLLESRIAPPAGAQRVGRRTLLRQVASGSVAAAALGAFATSAGAAQGAGPAGRAGAEQAQKAGALAQEQAQKLHARNQEEHAKFAVEREEKHSAAQENRQKHSAEHEAKVTHGHEASEKNAFGGTPLDLGDGWTDYAHGYQPAAMTRVGDLVLLSGMVTAGVGGGPLVAMLPEGARPVAGQIFAAFSRGEGGEGVARVEVLPDGQVVLVGRAAEGLVLSLSGIIFRADRLPRGVEVGEGLQEERAKLSAEDRGKSEFIEQDQKNTSAESSSKVQAEQDQKIQVGERHDKINAEQDQKLLAQQESEAKIRNQEQADKLRNQEQADKLSAENGAKLSAEQAAKAQ